MASAPYIKPIRTETNRFLLSRLWHGLVTFGCAITIPEEEEDETKELLTPALITASLTNDLFSFEKERDDVNVQNAVLVVMREHGCSEAESRDIKGSHPCRSCQLRPRGEGD